MPGIGGWARSPCSRRATFGRAVGRVQAKGSPTAATRVARGVALRLCQKGDFNDTVGLKRAVGPALW
eukprot:symbB.v1.2.014775.t1/scaffold1059.1/size140537/3